MSAQRTEVATPPRRSLLPAEFTLTFRRLDEAGERWAADYGTSTATGEGMAPLLSAFTAALVEVRRVADAGRESQSQDATPKQDERKTGGGR